MKNIQLNRHILIDKIIVSPLDPAYLTISKRWLQRFKDCHRNVFLNMKEKNNFINEIIIINSLISKITIKAVLFVSMKFDCGISVKEIWLFY